MSDQVLLHAMEFEGRHGVSDDERAEAQSIEIDIELDVDLRVAGTSDDIAQTVDYAAVFEVCRAQVEEHSYKLLEALAEAISSDVIARFQPVRRVVITVRKPGVPIDGVLDYAGVRLERRADFQSS
jgi:dihydroneopterin aldolase